jgi:hypothetical protein
MNEQISTTKKLQWKWVGITLLLYVVFYPSPIFIAHYILGSKVAMFFSGAWLFAGIIIIAAIAGYLSEAVTLWEPAIAAGVFIDLFFIIMAILAKIFGGGPVGLTFFQSFIQLIVITVIFFFFSLLGAWLGERAQKLWKTKSPQ